MDFMFVHITVFMFIHINGCMATCLIFLKIASDCFKKKKVAFSANEQIDGSSSCDHMSAHFKCELVK